MNLFNKKLLAQHLARYDFPSGQELEEIQKILAGWQKALKDSNLDRTKETGVQGQFLTKFFETVLGYDTQTSGKAQWHLNQEPKTEVDSQEADGSLGFFTIDSNKTWAVIELKDAKTSLDKKQSGRTGKLTPVEQAFQYLNKFDGCKWAIVSNFREIRIYSKSRGQGFYEKFDIVDLTQEHEFKRFYYVLNRRNLIDEGHTSVIDHLVADTTAQEENITKRFYEQYKEIRLQVLNHLFEHNHKIDKLVLVEKTQKLLDRLIFIMVCEDSSTLLPAHLIKNTYDRTFQSFTLSDSDQRVWAEFRGLFQAIDKGNKRVTPPINAYNGGLFKSDEILDNLTIKDEIWKEIIKLTQYDFESDLNVNVLGHIFEQSISDLEEIREDVYLTLESDSYLLTPDGNRISLGEKSNLKEKKGIRKKMGIFYTPEYITKYIVENTVGKYLEEHPNKLEDIKILDPACGSGAFLNQAHSFLLNEYKVKTEQKQLEKQQKGELLTLWDTNTIENDKTILLNNLFGVDLSPESVELTKLALWLKTAKSTEPLQNLDSNIKCGNSLIKDSKIAGDRAFDWGLEFKEISNNGGFDVIVGNPPYIKIQRFINSEDEEKYYKNNYFSSTGKYDAYVLFMEKAYELLNQGGIAGFILPHKFLNTDYGKGIRQFLSDKKCLYKIIDFGTNQVFGDATTYTCVIFITKKQNSRLEYSITDPVQIENSDLLVENYIDYEDLNSNSWNLISSTKQNVIKKIVKNNSTLGDLVSGIYQGAVTTGDDIFILDGQVKGNYFEGYSEALSKKVRLEASIMRPVAKGKDIRRYQDIQTRLFLIYPHVAKNNNTIPIEEVDLKTNYPLTFEYLSFFKDDLIRKKVAYKTNPKYWFSLHRARELSLFTNEKIITPQLQNYPNFTLNTNQTVADAGGYIIPIPKDSEYTSYALLAILNSQLMWFFVKMTSNVFNSGYYYFKTKYLEPFPIPHISKIDVAELTKLVKRVYEVNSKFIDEKNRVLELMTTRLKIDSTSNLENFYKLGWNEFVTELEKQKISADIVEQDNFNKWFNKVRKSLIANEESLKSLEKQIDNIIYKLYELNGEEVAIVEAE